ncbi:hypothetical protein LFAB_11970 [Lactiplantibacillus fabifermentans T30PCM01]|uniref:Uncharacterized protein n=1 Tax=Lactiplantibacillus fabifermentans T30PCM01 TaxID=1400520 RepID=W6T5Y2_9LACO|nr:hypothetical protein [Lactiplantibacillus fabifermentans]ETY73536.1 hypothetical protein LFAB_11970 [Lactiplantibacillus fabifermentans T30PCM01]
MDLKLTLRGLTLLSIALAIIYFFLIAPGNPGLITLFWLGTGLVYGGLAIMGLVKKDYRLMLGLLGGLVLIPLLVTLIRLGLAFL